MALVNLINRTVDRAEQDGKTGDAVEREAKATDARRTEQPADMPRKAELSVVSPTPMGGLSCLVRVAELLGFAGVVAVTASAALMGRCRR